MFLSTQTVLSSVGFALDDAARGVAATARACRRRDRSELQQPRRARAGCGAAVHVP